MGKAQGKELGTVLLSLTDHSLLQPLDDPYTPVLATGRVPVRVISFGLFDLRVKVVSKCVTLQPGIIEGAWDSETGLLG